MLIEVRCPNGHVLHVKDKHAGKIGVCPHCSAPVRVPYAPAGPESEGLVTPPVQPRPPQATVIQTPRRDRVELSPASSSTSSGSLGKWKLCVQCGRIVSQSFAVCPQCGTMVSSYKHLELRKEGELIVVQIGVRQILDEPIVKAVTEELCTIVDRAEQHDLIFDFSKVVSLSSLMLGKLVMLQKKLEQRKRHLRLSHVGAEIREVMAATKLDRLFHFEAG